MNHLESAKKLVELSKEAMAAVQAMRDCRGDAEKYEELKAEALRRLAEVIRFGESNLQSPA